ncbi:MAG: ATP-binding protein [Chlorobiota bacterium]
MKKISSKISLGYLIIVSILTIVIIYISYTTIKKHYINKLVSDLSTYTNLIQSDLNSYDIDLSYNEIISKYNNNTELRITIIDTSGIVLYDNESDYKTMDNHRNRPEILDLKYNSTSKSQRYSNTLDSEMLYFAKKVEIRNKPLVIRTSIYINDMYYLLLSVRNEILQISIIGFVISFIVIIIFLKNISNPIKKLSIASKKVAKGDFDIKLKLKSNDELGTLSKNFNYMTKQLKKLFNKVNSQKEQLDTLISEIREGLVVLDTSGKIKLCNEAFYRMLGRKNLIGKKLKVLFDESEIQEILEYVIDSKVGITKEIEYRDKIFICSSSWINTRNEIIILIHDITDIRNLETIKKDLIINVSHELRTPLTAIKGFSETLEEDLENSEHKRFANIISNHSNRLVNIVNDLILLSETEEKESDLEFEKVKVKDLVSNVTDLFEQKCKNNGIDFLTELNSNDEFIVVDNFKIEQLLINLIDNALKYTDKGEILLKTYREKENQVFVVKDTGVGISEEEQKRIFERFYTVDKSRSRQVGGTGLGLSIVKHITAVHNGTISINSKKDVGTEFIITIPANRN